MELRILEEEIRVRDELFAYSKDTMKHFLHPERRAKGIDMMQYELDYPIVKALYKRLKDDYEQRYGTLQSS